MAKGKGQTTAQKVDHLRRVLLRGQKMAVKLAGDFVGRDAQGMGVLLTLAGDLGNDANKLSGLLRDVGVGEEG